MVPSLPKFVFEAVFSEQFGPREVDLQSSGVGAEVLASQ